MTTLPFLHFETMQVDTITGEGGRWAPDYRPSHLAYIYDKSQLYAKFYSSIE